MIKCPSCGAMNEPGSRFCYQCGTDLRNVPPSTPPPPDTTGTTPSTNQPPAGFPSAPQPPGFPPPPPPPQFPPSQFPPPQGYDPARQSWAPEYMMPPEEPRRRRWLWVTLGLILGCIILCIATFAVASSSDTVSDFLTAVSEYSTEEAGN